MLRSSTLAPEGVRSLMVNRGYAVMNVGSGKREAQAAILMRAALDMLVQDGGVANGSGLLPAPASMMSPEGLAEWMYLARGSRSTIFDDDLFADPAWDILLDLYIHRGKQVSVTSACIAARVPSTTALRWLAILTDRGLVLRVSDPADRRRAFVALSPTGREKVHGYLEQAAGLCQR